MATKKIKGSEQLKNDLKTQNFQNLYSLLNAIYAFI